MEETICEAVSLELKKILKKGDLEGFKALVKSNNIKLDQRLFAKRKGDQWPLLNRVLDGDFSNRNFKGRFEIANYLIESGVDINDSAPYGCSPLCTVLNEHYYLRTSKAKYDVYLYTLVLALEMVRNEKVDVSKLTRASFGILDAAHQVVDIHDEKEQPELHKIASQIVKELVAKGTELE